MLKTMTEPQFGGSEHGTPPPPQPPQQAGYPPPYAPPPGPYPGAYMDPTAPYGRHPVTGEPLSDKSKVVAGLLQLIGLLGFLGFGRIYLGQTGLGIAQLVVGILFCWLLVPVIWGIIDAILIFTDQVRDEHGRPLREGT
jgi:TM2 domain-containing membrane protein YozV